MGSVTFAAKMNHSGQIHVPLSILRDYDLVPEPVFVVQIIGVTYPAYSVRRGNVHGRPLEYFSGDSFPYPYTPL